MRHSLTSILIKVHGVTYYRLNTGFFLLLILFGFGVLRSNDHLLLAAFFVENPTHLIIPAFLFAVYQFKALLFIRNQCHHKWNEFLYLAKLFPVKARVQAASRLLIFVNLPVLGYSAFIFFMGLLNDRTLSASVYCVIIIVFHLSGIFLIHRWLLMVPFERRYSRLLYGINRVMTRRSWLVFIEWLTRKELVFLLLTKAVSIVVLASCLFAFNSGDFDRRLLDFGVLTSFICTSIITFFYIKFDSLELSWKRNLPFRLYERFLEQLMAIMPLALPELILLVNWPIAGLAFLDKIVLLLYGVSIMLLLLNLQWTRSFTLEMLSKRIFWVFIFFTFPVLYGFGTWWFILINFTIVIVLHGTKYHTYEYERSTGK